jgi:hypothetical protein
VSTAQPYAVDQPAGREVVGAGEDAEDALVEVDDELVWSEEEIEGVLVVVDELAVTVEELVVLVLVLVLVITEVDAVLLTVEMLVLNATLDDDECVVDVVLGWLFELLAAQLDSAVPGHRPTLGMWIAPVLYHRQSASRLCKVTAKHTHGRVRALSRKVRAVELAEQRKASDERSTESIARRACIRARPLRRDRKGRSREGKESEGRVHDVGGRVGEGQWIGEHLALAPCCRVAYIRPRVQPTNM